MVRISEFVAQAYKSPWDRPHLSTAPLACLPVLALLEFRYENMGLIGKYELEPVCENLYDLY